MGEQNTLKGKEDKGEILAGPKKPYWECTSCSDSHNFASRIRCRCGQAAPKQVKAKAVKAAKALKDKEAADPLPHSKRQIQVISATSDSSSKLQLQVSSLKKQLAEAKKEADDLRCATGSSGAEDDEDMEEAAAVPTPEQVERLQSIHQMAIDTYGSDHELTKKLLSDLEVARRRRADSKPLDVRARNLESKLRQNNAQLEKAEGVEQEATAQLEEAQVALGEARLVVSEHKAKKAEIEAELAKLRRLQVQGGQEDNLAIKDGEQLLVSLAGMVGDIPEITALRGMLTKKCEEFQANAQLQAAFAADGQPVVAPVMVDGDAPGGQQQRGEAAQSHTRNGDDLGQEAKRQKKAEEHAESLLKEIHQAVQDSFKAKLGQPEGDGDQQVEATQDYSKVGYEAVLGYKAKLADSIRNGPYGRVAPKGAPPYGQPSSGQHRATASALG